MPEIRINVLDPADAEGLQRCYVIYRDAILKSEQRPEADFKALVFRPDYCRRRGVLGTGAGGLLAIRVRRCRS